METDFAPVNLIYKAFISDGKTGNIKKVCNMYTNIFCIHSYADRQTHFSQHCKKSESEFGHCQGVFDLKFDKKNNKTKQKQKHKFVNQ